MLQSAGVAVKAPVRGLLFGASGTPSAQAEDAEYLRLEETVMDMWRSPTITSIRQISEYIGPTPGWLASPVTEAA